MEDNTTFFETLRERATDYGKASFELAKLKALEKTSDVISSITPPSIVFFLFAFFMLFVNLGLAIWLGEILGESFYGFFVVAAFYAFAALVIYFLLRKWIKKHVNDYIIKQMFK